jgi:hypothetical protein
MKPKKLRQKPRRKAKAKARAKTLKPSSTGKGQIAADSIRQCEQF